MKPDRFTKVVLVVIVGLLLLLAIQTLKPQPVTAARDEILKVNIVRIDGYALYGSELEVNLVKVGGRKVDLADLRGSK